MKENKSSLDSVLVKTCSLIKDDCLDNLILTVQRAEIKRDDNLKRIFGKANHLYASIKRQQVELKNVQLLKSSDLIVLQQRLKDMEHKIRQLRTSLSIKVHKLAIEEHSLTSDLEQMISDMATEQILDFTIKTEGGGYSEPGYLRTFNNKRRELKNDKIIEHLLKEIQTFRQESKKGETQNKKNNLI